MIEFRRLTHEDYEDIIDISKSIWDGTDYLPTVFHKWVDDSGYFLGAVDTSNNKVIATTKFSILLDGTGWLEGLRVHVDYRGLKIARELSERILNIAQEYLKEGRINKIAFATYIENVESITLMKKLGFKLEKSFYLFHKEFDALDSDISIRDFHVKPWDLSYEDFVNLPYIKKRDNLFDIAFVFQEPSLDLYNELKASNGFVTINGYNGIFKLKSEPNFATESDSFEAINTFMNYYLLKYNAINPNPPFTTITEQDKDVIEKLKASGFESFSDWQLDYLYYVYK
jgi:RimJ/RimL family protein N-acetyltransferase